VAVERNWRRRHLYVELQQTAVEDLVGCRVLEMELLGGGLRNTNYRLRLDRAEHQETVLRLYTADAGACARESALLRRVAGQVPVPEVLRSMPKASPPWSLLEWVDGVRFDEMLASASRAEVVEACFSAGEVLAAIHDFGFASPGFLGPELEIAEPMGYSWLTGVSAFFAEQRARDLIGSELAANIVDLVDREAWRLADTWGQSQLVHADYKPWNLLVRRGPKGWRISAVLDWEFALSAPPLCDFGIFLRYSSRMVPEYASSFVEGYKVAGGTTPPDVRKLARLIDLVSVWTFLERPDVDATEVRDLRPVLEETLRAFA
jgi:aminoglycoside phosphotransferase (APT) family kinase protein